MIKTIWRKRRNLAWRENLDGYIFILPWLLGFLIWQIGPMLFSFAMSFTNWSGLSKWKWIGLKNYGDLFGDFLFIKSMEVTLKYSFMNVPLMLILGFLLALLLNQKIRFRGFYRTLCYLPAVISGVAVSFIWMWMLEPIHGILNYFLETYLGVSEGPNWLGHPTWALPALVLVGLWGVGGGMLIYLGGLQGIPTELYEAVEIDGGGAWIKFRYVTLPMMTPVLFFTLVMGIIGSLQAFGTAFVMTEGGPYYATFFSLLYIFTLAFRTFSMGYASTYAWILFLVILGFTLLVIKSSPMWVYYEGFRGKK